MFDIVMLLLFALFVLAGLFAVPILDVLAERSANKYCKKMKEERNV